MKYLKSFNESTTNEIKNGDHFKVKNLTKSMRDVGFFNEDDTYICDKVIKDDINTEIYVGDNWIDSNYCIKIDKVSESFLDWFKDDPSPQQRQEQEAIDKILPVSFSNYIQSNDFNYTLSNVVGLYNQLTNDLKSELVGKTHMDRKRDLPYTYTDCNKMVHSWMKKTNYKIYKIAKR